MNESSYFYLPTQKFLTKYFLFSTEEEDKDLK